MDSFMNQLKVSQTFAVSSVNPSAAGNNNDANAQAAFDLGYLAFLARGYAALEAQLANTSDPAARASLQRQMSAILAQYNKILSYFHVSGGKVTFDYNGTEVVEIDDPTIASLIEGMEGSSDITKFLSWYDAEKNSPVETILNWMRVNNFSFSDNTKNPMTEMAAVMFMLSLEGNPFAELGGITESFLEAESGLFGNTQILAELLCALCVKTGVDPSVIAACLSTSTHSPAFNELGKLFNQNYQSWIEHPDPNFASLADLLFYDGRFWPRGGDTKQVTVHAAPLSTRPKRAKTASASSLLQGDDFGPVKPKKITYKS